MRKKVYPDLLSIFVIVTTTEQTFEPSSTTSLTTTTSTTSKLTTTLSTHTTIQQTPIAVITHNNPVCIVMINVRVFASLSLYNLRSSYFRGPLI